MIATVIDGGRDDHQGKPQPCYGQVRTCYQRPSSYGKHVHHKVLQGIAIYGSHTHWCCPLVMSLVHQLVQLGMVEKPLKEVLHKSCDNYDS